MCGERKFTGWAHIPTRGGALPPAAPNLRFMLDAVDGPLEGASIAVPIIPQQPEPTLHWRG